MDWIVNNKGLAWNLTCVLRIERTCNSTVRFSKYVTMLICLVRIVVLG